mmetsp:Transcript_39473/g.68406  ORF Transcript_39473/g.68406 Transcript_39473/m.68406 type:complete len:307 (-) Transcript_39473:658-1578(-)
MLLCELLDHTLGQRLPSLVHRGNALLIKRRVQVGLREEHLLRRDGSTCFALCSQSGHLFFLLLLLQSGSFFLQSLLAHGFDVVQLPHSDHILARALVLHPHAQSGQNVIAELVRNAQHRLGVTAHCRKTHFLSEGSQHVEERGQQDLFGEAIGGPLASGTRFHQRETNVTARRNQTKSAQNRRDVASHTAEHHGRKTVLRQRTQVSRSADGSGRAGLHVLIALADQLSQHGHRAGRVEVIQQAGAHVGLGLLELLLQRVLRGPDVLHRGGDIAQSAQESLGVVEVLRKNLLDVDGLGHGVVAVVHG